MKAALLEKPGERLIITQVDDPRPGPGEIVIEVKACGVCHTDLHLAAGEWPMRRLPLILGHEIAGIVREVGPGVSNFKVNDRAGVPWIYSTCGTCEYCTSDREPLCAAIAVTGFTVDGGYAEYVRAVASYAVPMAAQLSFADAAPLYCAGLTPYRALKTSGLRVGEVVAVWGIGGLGHYAVQIAKAMGARVVAVDVDDRKLEFATELGAEAVLNISRQDPKEVFAAVGGAHVALILAPNPQAVRQAFSALRRGGTLVLVGLPSGEFSLPILGSVAKGIRILTSAVGTRQDLREVLALAAAGTIRSAIETCRLEEINEVFERMHAGRISARAVIEFG